MVWSPCSPRDSEESSPTRQLAFEGKFNKSTEPWIHRLSATPFPYCVWEGRECPRDIYPKLTSGLLPPTVRSWPEDITCLRAVPAAALLAKAAVFASETTEAVWSSPSTPHLSAGHVTLWSLLGLRVPHSHSLWQSQPAPHLPSSGEVPVTWLWWCHSATS